MSGSYRLQKKEIRESRKLYQPPQLMNSNLLSSHDKSEFYQQRINELSNVQDKSYISSQEQGHENQEFQELFTANKKEADIFQQPSSPIRKKSPSNVRRIQDYDIIVVQEQNQMGSNSAQKESVILEQIDFNSEEKQPEETPEWQNQAKDYKHEGVNYRINCVEAPEHFLVQQNENASSSSPYDFSTTQIKIPRVRNSTNTCVQRPNSRDSSHVKNFQPINKSCVAQPFNRQNSKEGSSSPNSSKHLDINQILNKWNNYIYPKLSNEYLTKDAAYLEEERRKTISQDIEKQAKYCISNYQNLNSRLQGIDDFSQLKSSSKGKQDKETQTQHQQAQRSQSAGNERIKNLQQKLKKYEYQNCKLANNLKDKQKELAYLRQNLSLKSEQVQNLKSTLQQTNQSRNKLYIDESKRMQSKNKELQKIINEQNLTIRVFQQKQGDLQKKLHETVSYLQKSVQMRPFESKSMQFQKINVFDPQQSRRLSSNNHDACNSKIQSLQEYIFDIEQKRVGIDLQVEKRLQKVTEQLQSQLKRNINQQYKMTLAGLKQQNKKLKQINRLITSERNEQAQKWQRRQFLFNEHQEAVKKQQNQRISQWVEIDRPKFWPNQIKNHFTKSDNLLLTSPRAANTFEHAFSANLSDQKINKHDYLLKDNYYQSKILHSPTKQKSNFYGSTTYQRESSASCLKELQGMPPKPQNMNLRSNKMENSSISYERMSFGNDNKFKTKDKEQTYEIRDHNDLYVINSKIQRLRSQINRELDLIH